MPIETKETSRIRREADGVRGQMDGLIRKAEGEGRDFSRREDAQYHRLQARLVELDEQKDAAVERYQQEKFGMKMGTIDPRDFQHQLDESYRPSGSPASPVLSRGESVEAWARQHAPRFAESRIEPDEADLGRLVRGITTNRWDGAGSLQAALMETGGSTGAGYLVPEPLSSRMIDRVRNAMRVVQAGAQTVPIEGTNQLSLARLVTGAQPSWKLESAPIAEDDLTFDRITFEVQTLPILVRLSQELFDDLSPEATGLIENEMAQALALEMDRVCLYGTGTPPEPEGIAGQTGVAGVAQVTDYDDLIDVVSAIRQLNYDPNGVLLNPALGANLAKLRDQVTGSYLAPPPFLAALPMYETNQVAVGDVFVGDWTQCLLGIRRDIRLGVRVLDQTFADSLEVGLLAYVRMDVQLAHPEAFAYALGTT